MTQERFEVAGTRQQCADALREHGFRCEHGVGWYKPGWLAMVTYRHHPAPIAEVADWDSANFVAAGWPSSAAPKNWL
jgi:hypothetical protein